MPSEELFDLVDETGRVVGAAPRSRCHGDPSLLHAVVHCLVCNREGALLLQRRSPDKDIQPDKWDTSVGGHLARGETPDEALRRELAEEIGLDAETAAPRFLYRYILRNAIESELVHTFCCVSDGPFRRQESEIAALRFWTSPEIDAALGTGVFTPNFEDEYRRWQALEKEEGASWKR